MQRGVLSICPDADRSLVFRRLRREAGFGLVELLMAMTILNIGILAVVGAFNSGSSQKRLSRLRMRPHRWRGQPGQQWPQLEAELLPKVGDGMNR